jgi:hypothetical protein
MRKSYMENILRIYIREKLRPINRLEVIIICVNIVPVYP